MLDELLEQARDDGKVIGVVVHGSRGRGLHVQEGSDGEALFRETAALAQAHGHGATIDGWEPDVAWLRGNG